jgi:hypothetical protein
MLHAEYATPDIATLRARLDGLRVLTAAVRLQLAIKANFNPAQLRVPAGQPGGGRWTRDGESVQFVADKPVDLLEEELLGGHTISKHVGKTPEYLVDSILRDRGQVGIVEYARKRWGSFPSLEAANKLVNSTLAQNQAIVDQVARGSLSRAFVTAQFDARTGIEAYAPSPRAQPYVRDTYGVGVEIRADRSSSRGFRVHSAYPRND